MTRRDELASGLKATRERIDEACRAAGREPGEVQLLPVTKFFPASDAALLAELGCTDVGENREQEAARKAAELPQLRWHMLGHIQRNKAKSVARWATLVHSCDSARLATALDRSAIAARDAGERDGRLPVLVQVSLDGDPDRGGVPVGDFDALVAQVADADGLELTGVMGVPPLAWEPERAFADLAEKWRGIRTQYPGATMLSAGMSGDLELAVRFGSTCVRVGTAILGARPVISQP
ncbi:YggS family pyridoxal phosphate-dependent enzyme [Tsukamurella sp. 8F]|uniref:YggS family pyridoxal phosphate-dependent enzyme n=1 Tax=unclassified Tsukamurella TaxID=2633480 RepID=UPI0023B8B3D2|nr:MULTISPECIES: YggS family pyridoxal phosphate-dependent enzyme [unclassified Tsukamurella]MDF0532440.1 YggS family pyridoxal phosphate-dependent enzyme [Tsukamurella sp. 8J]MDF0588451.1 YggS family pyridoxal phosphate-dependent enzyme [Tsukamurella sp. 8F]